MDFTLCVAVNVCIAVMFKLFPRHGINALNAIVINYTVSLLLGSLLNPGIGIPFHPDTLKTEWFKYDMLLGVLFICGFTLTAKAVERSGITLTTMMQKMSLVVTVSFTVLLFHEPFGILQGLGIVLALIAIVAINKKNDPGHMEQKKSYVQLFLVLLFSASIETILFYVNHSGVVADQHYSFTTHAFGCAAIIGWSFIGITRMTRSYTITRRDLLAGIMLGLPNFFSIFLLLRMLDEGWKAGVMYPLVNVSVLLTSTLVAFLIFKEKLRPFNWAGIGLAIIAILIIGYSQIGGQ